MEKKKKKQNQIKNKLIGIHNHKNTTLNQNLIDSQSPRPKKEANRKANQ